MKTISILLFFLLCITLHAGTQVTYFPHKVGLKWTMDVDFTTESESLLGTAHHEILSRKDIGGKTYYKNKNTITVNGKKTLDLVNYTRIDSKGLYMVESLEDSEKQIIHLPLVKGKSWDSSEYGNDIKVHVIEKTSIEVKGVKYDNVFHLRKTNEDKTFIEDFWVAQNLSTIKSTIKINGQTIRISFNNLVDTTHKEQ